VWPGGGATGGAAGAGHLVLAMKGRSGAAGGAGLCGRPTSAVAHVPTQRSELPLCASATGPRRRITHASAATVRTLEPRRSCTSRWIIDLIAHLLVRSGPKPWNGAAILLRS